MVGRFGGDVEAGAEMGGRRVTRAAAAAPELTRVPLPTSIRVVDEAKRIIEVCATSEAVDTFDTVFDYEASKDAFTRWAGNVREMHERKAVGRRVHVRCDDATKKIYVELRVSKGANDTWEKVLDGTLDGASIGASNVLWQVERRAGKERQVAKRYDLMELSLVDLASNPDSRGIAFVRDGVPDALVLDDAGRDAGGIAEGNRASAGSAPSAQSSAQGVVEPLGSAHIAEQAGSLSQEDVSVLIARQALARGSQALQALGADARSGGGASASVPALTSRQQRLAAMGAPAYVAMAERAAAGGEQNAEGQVSVGGGHPRGDALGGVAPGEGAAGIAVGQPYDVDGDHESASDYVTIQSGPTAGAVMAPSPAGSVAHMAHSHLHTGRYDDPSDHRETSAHMHLDGTSHIHEHGMDHRHGDHSGVPAGHAHPHIHVPSHDHSYRVADGAPLDARLVTVEQARTWECVSESAFRAAGGVVGHPLTVAQFRIAQGMELRLAQESAVGVSQRSLGPYSRNPDGPADAGTPAQAQQHASEAITGEPALGAGNAGVPAITSGVSDLEVELHRTGRCPLCQGQIRALDRDGQPVAGAGASGQQPLDAATTGTLDVSQPADGWTGRAVVSEVTRAVQSEVERLITQQSAAQLASQQAMRQSIEQRLARIEAQPVGGGPQLRAAEKVTALTPSGDASASDRLAALGSLAGRLADPQAQMAVAAEMIRLQQESLGMGPAMQVMPRAGGR